jgi:chloramphenicol 3-O-phosphotransferase
MPSSSCCSATAASLTLADTYRSAGFDAVIADNIFGELLDDFLDFAEPERVHLVVLHPSQVVVTRREEERGMDAYRNGFTIAGLWESLEHDTRRAGLWLDTSELTVEATVRAILERLDGAVVETSELNLGDR